jgi:hypothetical protein
MQFKLNRQYDGHTMQPLQPFLFVCAEYRQAWKINQQLLNTVLMSLPNN